MAQSEELRAATGELINTYHHLLELHNNNARAAFRYVLNLGKDESASDVDKQAILEVTANFYKERYHAHYGKEIEFTVKEPIFGETPEHSEKTADHNDFSPAPRRESYHPHTPTPMRFQGADLPQFISPFGSNNKRARQDQGEGSNVLYKKKKSTPNTSAVQSVEDTMDEELARLGTPRRSQHSSGPKVALPKLDNSPLRTARAAKSPSNAPATRDRGGNLFRKDNAGGDSGTGR